MKYLITAGPTHEYLDDVRFFGNASSGQFGYALAQAALRRGHSVTLVSGPTTLKPPEGAKLIRITSVREMLKAVEKEAKKADILVMNAAVSDYRPERRVSGKMKRKDADSITVKLVRNPDILKTIASHRRKPVLVGFALESQSPVKHALEKLRDKSLDFNVLNLATTIGSDSAKVRLFDRWGGSTILGPAKKSKIAGQLLSKIEMRLQECCAK